MNEQKRAAGVNLRSLSGLILPSIVFLFFFTIPITKLGFFTLMPGDVGDARLNNYFLENIFQVLSGHGHSLWHLDFFYPFPFVLGFSDNLFGASPAYILARLAGAEPDTSYQIWFLFGYVANFWAAYYALRRLKATRLSAAIGAVIFTFALPTLAHAGHAQLHYRFGIPLAFVFLYEFLRYKTWRSLVTAGVWLAFQFYAGVYMGFFAALLMVSAAIVFFARQIRGARGAVGALFHPYRQSWTSLARKDRIRLVLTMCFLFFAMGLLFYPYMQAQHLYKFSRPWVEIASMLPRWQSYFISDSSYIWSNQSAEIFSRIPMRWEHQMFIGAVPLALALMAVFLGSERNNGILFPMSIGALALIVVITLNIGGYSIWYLVHRAPLVNSIRAMVRIDQALLLLVSILAVIALDTLRAKTRLAARAVPLVILPLLFFEFSMSAVSSTPKQLWRQRIAALERMLPASVPANAVLFFAQGDERFFAHELDAMWLAMKLHKRTLNGYSGNFPPNLTVSFGRDCAEMPRRIVSYLNFMKDPDGEHYKDLMTNIVPVGFSNCDPGWRTTSPITTTDSIYSAEDVRGLTYDVKIERSDPEKPVITVTIKNSKDHLFAARSALGKPLRVSWRFLDAAGVPLTEWNTRMDLPFDIPANGMLNVVLPVSDPKDDRAVTLEVSMVQEFVFWAHDIGVPIASSAWK